MRFFSFLAHLVIIVLMFPRAQDRRTDARAGHIHDDLSERLFREARVEATCHTYLRATCVELERTPLRQRGDGARHARLRRCTRGGAVHATGRRRELQGRAEREEWHRLRLPNGLCAKVAKLSGVDERAELMANDSSIDFGCVVVALLSERSRISSIVYGTLDRLLYLSLLNKKKTIP